MRGPRCLLVFTKPAQPGWVKTRLIGELTAVEAAELHEALLGDLLERLAGGSFDLRILWALDGGGSPPESPLPSFAQHGGDLGERLRFGIQDALRDYPVVAAVGSDHPDLVVEDLEAGFEALEQGAGLVLGPAVDGGYYLIGAGRKSSLEGLFAGVEWSTPGVFATTAGNAAHLGLELVTLPTARDVDTAEDLDHLAASLVGDPDRCPRTYDLLARWQRLPQPTGSGAGR